MDLAPFFKTAYIIISQANIVKIICRKTGNPAFFSHSFPLAWQRVFWAAMVARVSPSCINKELMRLISSVVSPQAMELAKAVTATVKLQAFIFDHPSV